MTLPNPGMDFTPFDTLPAASLDDLVENIEALADGSALDTDSVNDNKLVYGKIRSRQGGNATNWALAGTNNYAQDANDTFTQCGVVNSSAGGDVTVTFPHAYAEKPVVTVSVFGGNGGDSGVSENAWALVNTVSTTGFTVRTINTSLVLTNQAVAWIAIGK